MFYFDPTALQIQMEEFFKYLQQVNDDHQMNS